MSKDKKVPYKGYRLISAYIRLSKYNEEDERQNAIIAKRFRAFHLFCVIIFSSFLLDGLIPAQYLDAKITGLKTITTNVTEIKMADGSIKSIITPDFTEIVTNYGGFITTELSGFEKAGKKIFVKKTRIFKLVQGIEIPDTGIVVSRFFNFFGKFVFWPIIALMISVTGLLFTRYEGSTTLIVLAILNIIPFFIVVYIT